MSTIDDLRKYTEKRTGVNLVKAASEKPAFTYLPTGVFLLDFALLGGIQEGTCSTIVGQKHSGKTTLCHKIVANYQKKYRDTNLHVAWMALGEGYDADWAAKNGVDTDKLLLLEPFDGESAVDIACAALDNDEVGLFILDSIPNLVPSIELKKSSEDMVIAPVATLAQRMLRKMSAIMAKANAEGKKKTIILINQWREKAGVSFGDPRTLPGGKYIRYYSSMEVEIYNKKEVTEKDINDIDSVAYNEHAFKIMKTRAGNSIKEGEFVMSRRNENGLREGQIDDFDVVTRYAQKFGLVEGAGPKWSLTHPYTGEVIETKGRAPIIQMVKDDPKLYNDLQRKVISLQRMKSGLSEDGWY